MTATGGYYYLGVVFGTCCRDLFSSPAGHRSSLDMNRRVQVLIELMISPDFFGRHIKLKVAPKMFNVKHTITNDHDDRRILQYSSGHAWGFVYGIKFAQTRPIAVAFT